MAKFRAHDAATLTAMAEAFRVISDALPARATTRQALAILRVFAANAAGQSITMSDLREFSADDGAGVSIGVTIAKTFSIFYEPTDREPDRLGWVTREIDTQDERVKFLKLTDKGAEVAQRVAKLLGQVGSNF